MNRFSIFYVALIVFAVAVALAERAYAAGNERRLVRAGGREVAPRVFRLLAPIYSLVFLASAVEHLLADRRPPRFWAAAMVMLFFAAKALKAWAVLQLRDRWTMRVIVPPSLRVAASGPYRYIRHPNYVALIGESVALPLAGGAWLTALVGGAAIAVILVFRIRSEEAALLTHPEYVAAMGGKGRFLPGGGAGSR